MRSTECLNKSDTHDFLYSKKNNINIEMNKHDLNFHLNPNHDNKVWTKQLSERLREISFESAGFAFMHDKDAIYYNKMNINLTIAATLLSTISAVAIASIISLLDDKDKIIFYIMTSITILINLLTACINAFKYINNYVFKIIEHSEKSAKFGELHRKISNQFALPLEHRYNGKTFLEYTESRFSELDREKPFIRNSTILKWEKKSKERPHIHENLITLPNEFNPNDNSNICMSTINFKDNSNNYVKRFNKQTDSKNLQYDYNNSETETLKK